VNNILSSLGFKDVLNSEGRPPDRSSDMLKLFMYGYKKKLRSSYQLEEACRVNLEVIWLMRGLRPSACKIAYFRKDNYKAFKQAFRHFVLLLKDMNLISGETIAIDSFKIRAQNSLKNNFNQKKIDRHLEYIDGKINEYLQELESCELEESQRQEALEENEKRVNENPDYYKLRQQITEHQFGTIKRQWGFTFTLMKGKKHVLSEVNLLMMCYNLRRLMSIFDINELKSSLERLVLYFLTKYGIKKAVLSF